jgi:hypothetical protein
LKHGDEFVLLTLSHASNGSRDIVFIFLFFAGIGFASILEGHHDPGAGITLIGEGIANLQRWLPSPRAITQFRNAVCNDNCWFSDDSKSGSRIRCEVAGCCAS